MLRSHSLRVIQRALVLGTVLVVACQRGPTSPTDEVTVPADEIRLDLFPSTVALGGVSAAAITLTNSSKVVRHNLRVDVTIPRGITTFLAWGTGGSCGNLTSNCIPGTTLYWTLAEMQPGERRTLLLPAKADLNASPPVSSIPFAVAAN